MDDEDDLDIDLDVFLAERDDRAAAATAASDTVRLERFAAAANALRARYHPKQAAFFDAAQRAAKKAAALTTRQSGKTSGGNRETLARCLATAGQRWVYCNATRAEAIKRCWRNDSAEGWLDLMRELGITTADNRKSFDKGIGDALVNEQLLTIDFRNGSQLDIFAADDEKSGDKLRGVVKDGIWIDEAQKFPFLARFVNAVVSGCLAKKGGECWLTGTPDEFLDGLFFEVTRDDDRQSRLPGWEVHEWSALDNPGFGDTAEERYAKTLGREIETRHLDPQNLPPDVIREWLGKWVTTAGRYVYRVHHLTDDELCFAPVRPASLPPPLEVIQSLSRHPIAWYDHAASVADLPRTMPGTRRPITWSYGLGVDFGFHPDPFAVALVAWSWDLPDLYEMWAWKQTRLYPTWQKAVLDWFWTAIPDIVYMVADPAGQAGAEIEGWQALTGLPIEAAEKSQKRMWIESFNDEISTRRFHYRAGSVLLDEHRHLLWRQVGAKLEEHADRRLQNGRVPGNHVSDAATYLCRKVLGARAAAPPLPPPVYDSPEWAAREERRMRQGMEDLERAQQGEMQGDAVAWYEY